MLCTEFSLKNETLRVRLKTQTVHNLDEIYYLRSAAHPLDLGSRCSTCSGNSLDFCSNEVAYILFTSVVLWQACTSDH